MTDGYVGLFEVVPIDYAYVQAAPEYHTHIPSEIVSLPQYSVVGKVSAGTGAGSALTANDVVAILNTSTDPVTLQAITATRAGNGNALTLVSTGASVYPYLLFRGGNASSIVKDLARVRPIYFDGTNGSEKAHLVFEVTVNGTLTEYLRLLRTGDLVIGSDGVTGSGKLYAGSIYIGTTLAIDSSRNLTIGTISSGTVTTSGDLIFSATTGTIRANTSDGSDTHRVLIAGGGSATINQGAYLYVQGNEYATLPGSMVFMPGNVAGSTIFFNTATDHAGEKFQLSGTSYFSGAAEFGSTITSNDNIAVNGGSLTSSASTFNLLSTPTVVNFAVNATTINIGKGGGSATFGDGTTNYSIKINGAAGNVRDLDWLSNGALRWIWRMDSNVESGSNTGSDIVLVRRADDGSYLSDVFRASRSSGNITWYGGNHTGLGTISSSTITSSSSINSQQLVVTRTADGVVGLALRQTTTGITNSPRLIFENPTDYVSGGLAVYQSAANTLAFTTGAVYNSTSGTARWQYNATEIRPTVNNAYGLGTSGVRWSTIYSVNADFSGTLLVGGAATISGLLTINNSLQFSTTLPASWWGGVGLFHSYGSLGSQGAYGFDIAWNGYRRTADALWNLMNVGAQGYTTASSIRQNNNGILFYADSGVADGFTPTLRLTVSASAVTSTVNINANSGTIASNQTTFNLFITTVTTANILSAATTITFGATTGTATFRNATNSFSGDISQTSSTGRIYNNYTSGIIGSGFDISRTANGTFLEIDNISVRNTLRTNVFQKDVVKAVNGYLYITDSGVVSGATATTIKFKASKSASFTSGMQLWIKDANENTGTITSIKVTLTNSGSTSGDETTYNCTYDTGAYTDIQDGMIAVRVSGGTILFDASSAYSPFMDISDGTSVRLRAGNLSGKTSNVFGSLSGYGLYSDNVYLEGNANIAGTISVADGRFYAGQIAKNLLKNSNVFTGTGWSGTYTAAPALSGTLSPDGINFGWTITTTNVDNGVWQTYTIPDSIVGVTYTFSVWLKGTASETIVIQLRNVGGTSENTTSTITFDGTWQRVQVSKTFTSNSAASTGIQCLIRKYSPTTAVTFLAFGAQLEKQSFATLYQSTDGTLSTDYNYGMWSIAGGFGGTMQNPAVMLDGNGLYVRNAGTIKNVIQDGTHIGNYQSATGYNGVILNHLGLYGYDNNSLIFSLDGNGLTITGTVNATSGYFSGSIYVGATSARTIIDGANKLLKSENYVAGTSGWVIKGDGTAEFRSATVRGTLNADDISAGTLSAARIAAGSLDASKITSGSITATQIASATITADRMSVSSLSALAANMGTLTSGSIVIGSTNMIWLNDSADGALNIGGSTKASAPFRVTSAGVLTATGATITGTITTTNGLVGGWTINATSLSSTNLIFSNSVASASAGKIVIDGSNSILYFSDKISIGIPSTTGSAGTIQISATDNKIYIGSGIVIDGAGSGTITGGTIQTSASVPISSGQSRILLDGINKEFVLQTYNELTTGVLHSSLRMYYSSGVAIVALMAGSALQGSGYDDSVNIKLGTVLIQPQGVVEGNGYWKLGASGNDGRLEFGSAYIYDTNLYRSAANILKTDDSFYAVGTIKASNMIYTIYSSDQEQLTSGAVASEKEFVQLSPSNKIRVWYRHRTGNKTLRASAMLKSASGIETARMVVYVNSSAGSNGDVTSASYTPATSTKDISALTDGALYEILVELGDPNVNANAYMKRVVIDVESTI